MLKNPFCRFYFCCWFLQEIALLRDVYLTLHQVVWRSCKIQQPLGKLLLCIIPRYECLFGGLCEPQSFSTKFPEPESFMGQRDHCLTLQPQNPLRRTQLKYSGEEYYSLVLQELIFVYFGLLACIRGFLTNSILGIFLYGFFLIVSIFKKNLLMKYQQLLGQFVHNLSSNQCLNGL